MGSAQEVIAVLEIAGFERLPNPLVVSGAQFDFEASARGTRTSHDLVLVATQEIHGKRLQRLVSGLARALDLAASRRPISLIIIGEVTYSDRNELERHARVLHIPSSTPSQAEIEEAIAVLLPLELPTAKLIHGGNPLNEVLGTLGPGEATRDHIAFLKAASGGPDAVREVLRRYVNEGTGWVDETDHDNV